MKIILTAFICLFFFPLQASVPPTTFLPEAKPMKVFVQMGDGTLYEAVIAKKGNVSGEKADSDTQRKFRKEAKKYGYAYLQNDIVLLKK